jgi:8-oxo-dGTP diphosphatase
LSRAPARRRFRPLARLLPLARLAAAPLHWARIAMWGLLSPRVERAPLVVVQAVVRGPEGVLLAVRHELRGWDLPGGVPEPGEDDAAALRREVLEETGVRVEVGAPVGTYRRTGFRPHEARVYHARPVGGAARPTREMPRVGWWDPDAPPDTLFAWCRAPLRDARAGGPPVSRTERQGAAAVLDAMAIDLRMRVRNDGDPAGTSDGASSRRETGAGPGPGSGGGA